ncbi:MAG: replication factor A, partial [Halobacteriaceae archaeon]
VGLLGDSTGTIKFTAWAKSDLEELEEDTVYRLENIVTDEYEGRYSVKLNRTTTIEELDEDIDVGSSDVEFTGAMVDIQSGSGLIKRCPKEDCTRVLQNGRCSEHGDVEGEFDLRVKAVLDNGTETQEVIFDQDITEGITGITLEDAKQQAMDALDTSVVADQMREDLIGKYYRAKGPSMGRYILANSVEELTEPDDTEAVLIKARSI